MSLSEGAQEIFEYVVDHVQSDNFRLGQMGTYVTYKKVHDDLDLRHLGGGVWENVIKHGLEELSIWLVGQGLPLVPGIIINGTKSKPGRGYFDLNKTGMNNLDWWEKEIEHSVSYDWGPYIDGENLNHRDLNNQEILVLEGARKNVEKNDRVRAEHLRNGVREHYRKEKGYLYCHVCDYSPPEIEQGAEMIELHHTHPLAEENEDGDEYTLEEAAEMLTPLCPTCHRLAHAKPNQELFTVEEIKAMVGKS